MRNCKKGVKKMGRKNGKIPPAVDNSDDKKTVIKSYIIVIIPVTLNLKANLKESETEIIVPDSVKIEIINNDISNGIVAPDYIDVESYVYKPRIVLIAHKNADIKIDDKNTKVIVVPKTTRIIPIKITIGRLSNSRVADGYLMGEKINYNSDNSGNEERELALSA
jgi:hypothetical protein